MKTADSPKEHTDLPPFLPSLEAQLQAALQTETLLEPPIAIQCKLQQDTLRVIAQHPIALPNPRQIFTQLEQTLYTLPAAAIPLEPVFVQLYLRVIGQQPYAAHTFTFVKQPDTFVKQPDTFIEQPSQIVRVPTDALETSTPIDLIEQDKPQRQNNATFIKLPAPVLIAATIVGLAAFSGSLYALTRPCVVGACVPLQRAEQLSQAALQTAQTTTSAQAVVVAYDQLVEANYLLSTIPPWSKQHSIAQTRLPTYSNQATGLEQIVSALRQAQTAAQRSQNPPHPFREWQDIQTLWQQAIARLEAIPSDSPVAVLAQRKITEYRASLATIVQRIAIERQAQEKVNTARSTARIAEARAGVAASAEGWQLSHATWQTVVNTLKQVPQTTMAHAEAAQLLAIYQPKLAATRDRATGEGISATAYNQAIDLANRARGSEQQKQWSQAVDQWRSALTHAQQVPNYTSYYAQAQPLVNAYTASLTRAQEILRVTMNMQSANADLSRTCFGIPKICDYSFGEKNIQVRITPDYDRAVEQAMVRTQATRSDTTQAEVAAHVNTLLRALAAISENANVAIELYNSDGSLFGTYEPQFSGYVAR